MSSLARTRNWNGVRHPGTQHTSHRFEARYLHDFLLLRRFREPGVLHALDYFRYGNWKSGRGKHIRIHPKRRTGVLAKYAETPQSLSICFCQTETETPVRFRHAQRTIPKIMKLRPADMSERIDFCLVRQFRG